MKRVVKLAVFAIVIVATGVSIYKCKKDSAIPNSNNNTSTSTTTVNLITNSSFEDANGNASMQGWYPPTVLTSTCPTEYMKIYKQGAPIGGGNYSLLLCNSTTQGPCPEIYNSEVKFHLGKINSGIYKLKAWTKFVCGTWDTIFHPCGALYDSARTNENSIYFFLLNKTTNTKLIKKIYYSKTYWSRCDTSFFLNNNSNDSIDLLIYAGPWTWKSYGHLIDLIEVEKN